jgi:carbamoyl-phosphate synthase large subunit
MCVQGTQAALEQGGVKCERVLKIQEGRPNAGDMLKNGEISMLMLTTTGERQSCCLLLLL